MPLVQVILRLLGEPEAHSREQLQAKLTVLPAREIPATAWPLLQNLWQEESRQRQVVDVQTLPMVELRGTRGARLSLWRGDITHLNAGAIVNAANSGLTGCYQPFHRCVDNVIHSAAGPWLRQACEAITQERGRPEPTATATATPGFFLPAQYVIHTVGPIVHNEVPSSLHALQLARCYREAIELAASLRVDSIAFCAISTGVFGYPKAQAARVSLDIIVETLQGLGSSAPHVIVTAYTEADERIYDEALLQRGALSHS